MIIPTTSDDLHRSRLMMGTLARDVSYHRA
jgi:hypothetical protein